MKFTRRMLLRGIGGSVLTLPLLESFSRERAWAQDLAAQRYAIFFRQASGVAAEQYSKHTNVTEPERFWPRSAGALTADSMNGRAVDELAAHRSNLLIVDGLKLADFPYGDGHANGAMGALTLSGPVAPNKGGSSEANGMSIDHLIGAELNPKGVDSLFLYSGVAQGWLGGPCISYRAPGSRRNPHRNPRTALEATLGNTGLTSEAADLLATRGNSINDLVREQMRQLLGNSRLSSNDKERLQLHFDSIRDIEVKTMAACQVDQALVADTNGADSIFDSTNGNDVIATTRLHMDVLALAIACGHTRSAAIQVGTGNDGRTRYPNPATGQLMENYHYISHRMMSHAEDGALIANADLLHHQVDRHFARMFNHLLDRLSAYAMPDGKSLLEHGASVWYNDLGSGPSHSSSRIPFIVAGSANGYLKQGQTIKTNASALDFGQALRTVAYGVGVQRDLDGFGDPQYLKGELASIKA